MQSMIDVDTGMLIYQSKDLQVLHSLKQVDTFGDDNYGITL